METSYTIEFRTGPVSHLSYPIKVTLPNDNYLMLSSILNSISSEGDTLKVKAKTGRYAEYRHFYNHGNGQIELSAITLG